MLSNDLKNQFDALLPPGQVAEAGPRRRAALQAALGLGLGYAAAAGPLQQTAIHTTAEGLEAGRVTIDSNGFALSAYCASPTGKTDLPVVLVVQEIFGVHEYIADICRRLARHGYLAIAPSSTAARAMPQVHRHGPADERAGLQGARCPGAGRPGRHAQMGRHGGRLDKAAVTGFAGAGASPGCMPRTRQAAVPGTGAWSARPASSRRSDRPCGRAQGAGAGPVGGADSGIPLDTVERMKAALAAGPEAARASQFVVYPDTPHAFHADYRLSYLEPAEDGWKRMLAWFAQHGVA
jgi:carboxymethylenebutenolidase